MFNNFKYLKINENLTINLKNNPPPPLAYNTHMYMYMQVGLLINHLFSINFQIYDMEHV